MEARLQTIRVVCAHDCPDMCSLLAQVEDGRVVRVQGDPDQPFTAGFACAKVNRDAELVHSPERIATPLRRIGPKGAGQFAPITWDEALDEITSRWKAIIAQIGPAGAARLRLQRPSGPDEPRPGQRAVPRAGHQPPAWPARCATPAARPRGTSRSARSAAPIPESVDAFRPGDLLGRRPRSPPTCISGRKVEEARKTRRAARRDRSAPHAAPPRQPTGYLPIRIGTDAALALGVMHILVRDRLADRDYIAAHTLGFDRVEREVLPTLHAGDDVAEITGLPSPTSSGSPRCTARAKAAFIRLGEGMTRLTHGGQALRTVALLPGVTGAYGREGRRRAAR